MDNYTKLKLTNLFKPGITSLLLVCGITMCYGWGWRGNYGHEYGAMFAAGLLAMAAALTSGRKDWYRHSLIIAMFAAVGWSFGGSMSYMEHNWYINSGTWLDTAYGYFGFGFVALLWTGVGAAILALALTKKTTELEKYVRIALVIGIVWIVEYLYFVAFPAHRKAVVVFIENNFHDGEFSAAVSSLIITSIYWLVRPQDRQVTKLYLNVILGWWAGYLVLTKFGGLYLAPPYRSESWGGNVGMLIVLILHHYREKNRAAILLINYAMLTGTIAYILAVFIHNPIRIGWNGIPQVLFWKIAEEGFGLFMGLGIGLGFVKLLKGGLSSIPSEAKSKKKLDIYSAYLFLIVLMWLNLRKNVVDWGNRYDVLPEGTMWGLEAWQWFLVIGILATLFVVWGIRKFQKDKLILTPKYALDKGVLFFIILMVISLIGAVTHRHADWGDKSKIMADVTYYILAILTVWSLVSITSQGKGIDNPIEGNTEPNDKKWNLNWKFHIWWVSIPVLIAIVTWLTVMMHDPSYERSRKRFGPDAYWRLEQIDK